MDALTDKVASLASNEEKKTLNEWRQISRKIADKIESVPGEVASPKPRYNPLIEFLLAPVSFMVLQTFLWVTG